MIVHSPTCAWQRLDDNDEVADCECQQAWPEVEAAYEDFWKPLVENPDGSLNVDQVKRELHDYYFMIREVPKVYMEVTRGRVSKPNTTADAVLWCMREAQEEEETCSPTERAKSSHERNQLSHPRHPLYVLADKPLEPWRSSCG